MLQAASSTKNACYGKTLVTDCPAPPGHRGSGGTQLGSGRRQMLLQRLERAVHEVLADFVHHPRAGRLREFGTHQSEERRTGDDDQLFELVLASRIVEPAGNAPGKAHGFVITRIVLATDGMTGAAHAFISASRAVAREVTIMQMGSRISDAGNLPGTGL